MPVTELPVPVYPPTYQQDNFTFTKICDGLQTELHQVPRAEFQGPPQDVVEMTFARFQTPWEVTLPKTIRTWKILETREDSAQWVMTVGPDFQSHRLPPVTIFLLFHNFLLLVCSRHVHILFGMCRYNYVSLLLVVHPFHSRMIVL